MRRTLAFILLLALTATAQQKWVNWKSISFNMEGGKSDTVYIHMGSRRGSVDLDTVGTNTTSIAKSGVAFDGYASLYAKCTTVSGTLDSVRAAIYPLDGTSGSVAKLDSSFVLASSSTYIDLISTPDNVALNGLEAFMVRGGYAIIFTSGDVATDTGRVLIEYHWSQ